MEAAGLCDTIFEFMGPPVLPKPVVPEISTPSTGPMHIPLEACRSEERAVSQSSVVAAEGDPKTHQTTAEVIQHHQLQKDGMLLAFVGNKLGEYNLRGVEAGIAMVCVKKKTGKALKTKTRRKARVARIPYEGRPHAEKKTNASH